MPLDERHDFSKSTKIVLAQRVGGRCSNPICGRSTSGPHSRPDKATIIGVASHITAAAQGGPRYDPSLSSEGRKAPDNGIWLCQNCAKLIDSDVTWYTIELLLEWKAQAEAKAHRELAGRLPISVEPDGRVGTIASAQGVDRASGFSEELSSFMEQDLEKIRNDWRTGSKERANRRLKELISHAKMWKALRTETQAKVLCFAGSLELDFGHLAQAKKLADEAAALAPTPNEARLRALIAMKENNLDAALGFLSSFDEIDTANLRAAILFDVGEFEEGFNLIYSLNERGNAESYRILALGYLSRKQLEQAQHAIQKALELQPTWTVIRYAAAVIDYFSALSPVALPDQLAAWPYPVDWTLVKCDGASLRRLDSAAYIFADLAGNPEEEAAERERLLVWQLASLANLPGQQEKAIERCRELLAENPSCYAAILWGVARNWDIDLLASQQALEEKVKEQSAEVSDVLALTYCYFRSGCIPEIVDLLHNAKVLFETPRALIAWRMTLIRALLAGEQFDEARTVIESLDDETKIDAEIMLLGAQAERDDCWQPLSEHFLTSFERTGDAQLLLGYYETEARQGNWNKLAKLADQLLDRVTTSGALRLAVRATYNAGWFQECLNLIDTHTDWFDGKRLPLDVRRIRIACLRALGVIPNAIGEAEELVREDPSTQHLSNLIQLCIEMGDLRKLALYSRRLLGKADVSPDLLLRLTGLLRGEDPNLSKSLWYQAVGQGIPDESVGPAFTLALSLGIEYDEKLQQLRQRLFDLGARNLAGVFITDSRQLAGMLNERREHWEFLDGLYRDGNIPIHLIAEQMDWPLAHLYHLQLARNSHIPDPLRQPMLLARHGGKVEIEFSARQATTLRLNLDITAILLAEHLGLLEIVEQVYAPLFIPSSIVLALLYMEERLQHHQPFQIRAAGEVLRYVQDRSIEVFGGESGTTIVDQVLVEELGHDWVSLRDMAISNDGYVCCFLPLRKNDLSGELVELPADIDRLLVNAGMVVQKLFDHGVIARRTLEDAVEKLGTEGEIIQGYGALRLGANLFCLGSVVQLLAQSGVLPVVCRNFHVVIAKAHVDRIQLEVDAFQDTQETGIWLRNLRHRIVQGIESGTYKIIPESARVYEIPVNNETSSPYEACVLTLLDFDPDKNDVIWVDDRHINSYGQRDGIPIIGINEVLKALKTRGTITEDVYYDFIHRLRAADVRFMPLNVDEILFHLKQARIENAIIIETLPLKVIRKYYAASLLQGNILQRPPLPEDAPNSAGEIYFAARLERTVAQALVGIWTEDWDSPEVCYARSNWLWSALALDLANIRRMVFEDEKQNDLYLTAVSYASLLSWGLQLSGNDGKRSVRKRYYEWLSNRVLDKKLMAEPSLAQAIAEILKETFIEVQQNSLDTLDNDNLRVMAQWVLQQDFSDLPGQIQLELHKDSDFVARLGIDHVTAIELGDLVFIKSASIEAARQALNGSKASVRTVNEPLVWVTYTPLEEGTGRNGFCYVHPISGTKLVVQDDRLVLLSDSISQRKKILRQHPYWIDAAQEEFVRISAEISSMAEPEERLNRLDEQMASSAAVYYSEFGTKIMDGRPFAVDDLMPPNAAGLLRHHRLMIEPQARSDFHTGIAKAAEDLLHTTEIVDALDRLMGLPVPLPDQLIEAIRSLSDIEKRSVCHALLRKMGSPTAKIHGIYVLLHLSDDFPALKRLAKCVALSLISTIGSEEYEAFATILKWVTDHFAAWNQMSSWPSHMRVAMTWSHANRLFCIFRSAGAPLNWLRDHFRQLAKRDGLPSELIGRDFDAWTDIAHPHRLTPYRFLLQGFAYAFQNSDDAIDEELRLGFEKSILSQQTSDTLRDPMLSQNSLDSFLGRDYGESRAILFGAAAIPEISHSVLRGALIDLVQNQLLKQDQEQRLEAWTRLGILLEDLPPPETLKRPIHTAMSSTNFAQSFSSDPILCNLALRAAAQQMRWLGDENLRSILKTQLVSSAATLAESRAFAHTSSILGLKEARKDTIMRMVEIAHAISLASPPDIGITTDFAQLLEQLFRVLPEGLYVAASVVQRLYEELPIAQAKDFLHLYLRIRTTS